MQQLFASLVALATIIAGLVALLTLLQTLTRGARLRHREAQWRAALEPHVAETMPPGQRRLLADLYRHNVAEQLSAHLVGTTWRVRAATVVLFVLVGAELAIGFRYYEMFLGLDALPDLLPLLVMCVVLGIGMAWALIVLVGHASARAHVTHSILTNRFPVRVAPPSPALERLHFSHPVLSTAEHSSLVVLQVVSILIAASCWGAVLAAYPEAWADGRLFPDSGWQAFWLPPVALMASVAAWGGYPLLTRRPPTFFSRVVRHTLPKEVYRRLEQEKVRVSPDKLEHDSQLISAHFLALPWSPPSVASSPRRPTAWRPGTPYGRRSEAAARLKRRKARLRDGGSV